MTPDYQLVLDALLDRKPQSKTISTLMQGLGLSHGKLFTKLESRGTKVNIDSLRTKTADDNLLCHSHGGGVSSARINEEKSTALINAMAELLIPATPDQKHVAYREAFITWQQGKLAEKLEDHTRVHGVKNRGSDTKVGVRERVKDSPYRKTRIDEETIEALKAGTVVAGRKGLLAKLTAQEHLGSSINKLLEQINRELNISPGVQISAFSNMISEGIIRIRIGKTQAISEDDSRKLIHVLAEALIHDAYGDDCGVLREAFRQHFHGKLNDALQAQGGGKVRPTHQVTEATTGEVKALTMGEEESLEDRQLRKILEARQQSKAADGASGNEEPTSISRIHGRRADKRGEIGPNRTRW